MHRCIRCKGCLHVEDGLETKISCVNSLLGNARRTRIHQQQQCIECPFGEQLCCGFHVVLRLFLNRAPGHSALWPLNLGLRPAIYRCGLAMGLRVQKEVQCLDPSNDLRPDLIITLPGRRILSDVAVVHPLATGHLGRSQLGTARNVEGKKRDKYSHIALARHFEQLPFVCETTGGLGPSAAKLIRAMALAGEEHLAIWTRHEITRQLIGSVAMAVQRGGVMAYLEGYDRSLHALTGRSVGQMAVCG